MNNFDSNSLPTSITELLRSLIGERVTIILESGEIERIRIIAVSGDLLVAEFFRCSIKFVRIDCICAVRAECTDILENILRSNRC